MSQLPASLPTTLPPKCHPTWGTAPPPRPMWPEPRGSRPVAVLSLPTAVTSPPRWPSGAPRPPETASTRWPPPRCEEPRVCEGGDETRGEETSGERTVFWGFAAFPLSMKDSGPRDSYLCPPPPHLLLVLRQTRINLNANSRTGVLQDWRTAAPSSVNSFLSDSLLQQTPGGPRGGNAGATCGNV